MIGQDPQSHFVIFVGQLNYVDQQGVVPEALDGEEPEHDGGYATGPEPADEEHRRPLEAGSPQRQGDGDDPKDRQGESC